MAWLPGQGGSKLSSAKGQGSLFRFKKPRTMHCTGTAACRSRSRRLRVEKPIAMREISLTKASDRLSSQSLLSMVNDLSTMRLHPSAHSCPGPEVQNLALASDSAQVTKNGWD